MNNKSCVLCNHCTKKIYETGQAECELRPDEFKIVPFEHAANCKSFIIVTDKKNPFQKKDYSSTCTMDDDNETNPCWQCICFCFPIGCMKGEWINDKTSNDKK